MARLDMSGDRLATLSGFAQPRHRPCTTQARLDTAGVPERELNRPNGAVGMPDVEALSRFPAGHNRDTVSDDRQNVVHGQDQSVDAIDAQEPGARLAGVENCKRVTR
jgi:hypothetical protein